MQFREKLVSGPASSLQDPPHMLPGDRGVALDWLVAGELFLSLVEC